MSKISVDLLMLIEADYRDKKATQAVPIDMFPQTKNRFDMFPRTGGYYCDKLAS